MTWSDSEEQEESNNDDESENFTAFMTSVAKLTELSSKALKTKEPDDEDKCEL